MWRSLKIIWKSKLYYDMWWKLLKEFKSKKKLVGVNLSRNEENPTLWERRRKGREEENGEEDDEEWCGLMDGERVDERVEWMVV